MLRLTTQKTIVYLLLCLPFIFFISLPVLQAGYFSDDILNSLIPGSFANQHIHFFRGLMQYMNEALMIGRFYPLSVFSSVTVFYLFQNLMTYQFIRVLFIWLSIISYACLVKQITSSTKAAWLLVMLVPMCWSIRDMPDPLVSFAILLPLLSLWMSLCLIFYVNYQKSGDVYWRGCSLLMYIFALATYEFGLTTFFMLGVVAMTSPYAHKKAYTDLTPYIFITLGYLVVSDILRIHRVDGYDGIMLGQMSGFISTFFAQLGSSFPFSYFLFAHEPVVSFSFLVSRISTRPDILLLAIYVYGLVLFASSYFMYKLRLSKAAIICLVTQGLVLMIIPAALIAMSSKYQHIITPGKGYLGVYLQYFGLGMVLIALLGWFNLRKRYKIFYGIFSVVIGSILIYGWMLNTYVVSVMNHRLASQRILIESALQHHLLANFPRSAALIEPLVLWNNADFYQMHSHLTIEKIYDINDLVHVKEKSYLIQAHVLTDARSGYVLLGPVLSYHARKINSTISLTDQVTTLGLKIFIAANSRAELDAIVHQLATDLHLTHEDIAMIAQHYQNSSYPIAASVTLPSHRYLISIQTIGMKI